MKPLIGFSGFSGNSAPRGVGIIEQESTVPLKWLLIPVAVGVLYVAASLYRSKSERGYRSATFKYNSNGADRYWKAEADNMSRVMQRAARALELGATKQEVAELVQKAGFNKQQTYLIYVAARQLADASQADGE